MSTTNSKTPLLGGLILLLTLWACAGGKESIYSFVEEPPFKLEHAQFQKWVAGVQGGGSGVNVQLTILDLQEGVQMKEVYFRNQIVKARTNMETPDYFTAEFLNQPNPDVIMDGDAVKEAQNTPAREFPFQLKENESVVSYSHKGEVYFVKISNMEEKPMLAYPGQNPNGAH